MVWLKYAAYFSYTIFQISRYSNTYASNMLSLCHALRERDLELTYKFLGYHRDRLDDLALMAKLCWLSSAFIIDWRDLTHKYQQCYIGNWPELRRAPQDLVPHGSRHNHCPGVGWADPVVEVDVGDSPLWRALIGTVVVHGTLVPGVGQDWPL